jgi:glycolate oxidase FAD binding subunit
MEPASISNAAENAFVEIVGPDHVLPASPSDSISSLQPRFIVEPGTEQELSSVLRLANETNLAVIPRGGGTKVDWGNPPTRADLILSTARTNKILEHASADLTVSVEAGCTIQDLQSALAQHAQRLALDPLWPEKATIGGVLSTNDSGALRLRFGALRDLIIGVTLALADGTLASSGGKVVKNVAGYDLPKLATGALGTLGVITRAVFRLHPLPHNARTYSVSAQSFKQTQRLLSALQDSKLAHTALQARFAEDCEPVVDILFEGTEAGISAQVSKAAKIAEPAKLVESPANVWNARQVFWDSNSSAAIGKFGVLPREIAKTSELIQRIASVHQSRWKIVAQATGIGWLRLDGGPENLHLSLLELRSQLERGGGSLVIFRWPREMPPIDTWGQSGDALPLMRAVKRQFDPKNTLNPGRFVGGI